MLTGSWKKNEKKQEKFHISRTHARLNVIFDSLYKPVVAGSSAKDGASIVHTSDRTRKLEREPRKRGPIVCSSCQESYVPNHQE